MHPDFAYLKIGCFMLLQGSIFWLMFLVARALLSNAPSAYTQSGGAAGASGDMSRSAPLRHGGDRERAPSQASAACGVTRCRRPQPSFALANR